MKRYVSTDFMRYCFNSYPSLSVYTNFEYRRFFIYLCFGKWRDKDTGNLIVSREVVFQNNKPGYDISYFRLIAFLNEIKSKVLPDFEYYEYKFSQGRATTVIQTGFSAELLSVIQKEMETPFADKTKTWIDFGSMANYEERDAAMHRGKETREALKKEVEFRSERKSVPTILEEYQDKMIDYLHGLSPTHLFLKKYNSNIDHINATIELLTASGKLGHDKRLAAFRILNSIETQPLPLYRPSKNAGTCRIHCVNDTVVNLKSEIRKAFCHGWTEADLKSSQLAILVAKVAGLDRTRELLESGTSIWDSYNSFLYGEKVVLDPDMKVVYKQLTYSIPYGRAFHRTEEKHLAMLEKCRKNNEEPKEDIERYLKKHKIERLIDHPVIKELSAARSAWYREIKANGGMVDAFGNFHSIKKRSANEIGCTYIQSIEMNIMMPLFKFAVEKGESYQFQLVIWQHDGCTISFKNKDQKMYLIRQMKKCVETHAYEAFGVTATLEFKDL